MRLYLLLIITFTISNIEGAEIPLPVTGMGETTQLRNCRFAEFQGAGCKEFMQRLCAAIHNKNTECLSFEMNLCHNQGDNPRERINSEECRLQEAAYCRYTAYKQNDLVCDKYHYEYCELERHAKTRNCLLFKQRFNENKEEEKLEQQLVTHTSGHATTKRLKDTLPEVIVGMDTERGQLQESEKINANNDTAKQLKKLTQQITERKATLEDALDVFETCQSIQRLVAKPVPPARDCNSDSDSTCPKHMN